jgi:mono/diheme cytochrome c family protein
MPDGKPGEMPPFAQDALTEPQVKDLYDYVSVAFR